MNWVGGSQEKLGFEPVPGVEEQGQGQMQQTKTNVTNLLPSCTS
jgi:hypothetical protein